MHSFNAQVFRGFFKGRYIFDSVTGFLRYASPAAAGGFGPNAGGCSNGTLMIVATAALSGWHDARPAARCCSICRARDSTGPATDAAGASKIKNEELRCSFRTNGRCGRTSR